MLELLTQSAFSNWMLRSESIWGYPIVLTLHTFGMMVLVGAALAIDLRLLGFAQDIPLQTMDRLFRLIWCAMVLSAITGIMLFIPSADVRARQLLFWSKLGFVAAGLVTTTMIRRGGFQENVKPVNVSGAARWLPVVSIVVWLAAITGGRFLAYFK